MSTYEQILEAAFKEFAELGYEKASLSLIANKVGISKPALYHHFTSKDALFETLYDEIILEIINGFHTDLESWTMETYVENLTDVGLCDIRYLKEHPQLGSILKQYHLLSMRQEGLKQKTQYLEEKTFAYHQSLINCGVVLGFFKNEEAEFIAEVFNSQLAGISWGIIVRPTGSYELSWQIFMSKLLNHKK